MAAEMIRVLWVSTVMSSAAILLVLLLRRPLRLGLGAQAAYLLWALVPLSALCALLPVPRHPLPTQAMATAMAQTTAVAVALPAPARLPMHPEPWLAATWLIGVLGMLGMMVRQQRHFVRGLGQLLPEGNDLLRAQMATAGCPALLGAIRPRVVLPVDFEQRYRANERELILAHEFTHRARGDALMNALAAVLRCAFWFNPLFHLAMSRYRFDQELACDASVILRHPGARRTYAVAMMKTQLIDQGLPLGCHWQSSQPLKERIKMLKRPSPGHARRLLGAIAVSVFVLGGGYAAWAAQPARIADNAVGESTPSSIHLHLVLNIDGATIDRYWHSRTHGYDAMHHDGVQAPGDWQLAVEPNKPFSLEILRAPGESWKLSGTVDVRPDHQFMLNSTIEHDGTVVSAPRLLVRDGKPAEIQIGKETKNGFKGFAAQLTLTRAHPVGPAASKTAQRSRMPASYQRLTRIEYPSTAVQSGMQGIVYLRARISSDGKVVEVKLDRVDPASAGALAKPALDGVKSWTFNPARIDGKAVASDERLAVIFALRRDKPPRASAVDLDPIVISAPDVAKSTTQAGTRASPRAELTDTTPATEQLSYRRMFPPKYPREAVVAGQSGKIILKVKVDANGYPQSAAVYKAIPAQASRLLADASIAAAMRWQFNPAMKNGRPVVGYALLPFTFSIIH